MTVLTSKVMIQVMRWCLFPQNSRQLWTTLHTDETYSMYVGFRTESLKGSNSKYGKGIDREVD